MSVSGIYSYYTPDIAAIMAEVFERSGVDAKSPGNDHMDSFFRSLNLLLNSEWQNLNMRTWMMQLLNFTTTPGYGSPGTGGSIVPLPGNVLAVQPGAILRRDNRDTPINPMSREEYLEIPDKTQTGRPDRYFVERLSFATAPLAAVNMYLWRAPENNTDQIFYWAFCVMSQPGDDLTYTLDVRPEMLEALHAGMAAKMAMKFKPERYQELQIYYRGGDPNPRNVGGVLALALDANRDFGDVRFTISRTRKGR